MHALVSRFRPYFFYAGLFSLAINLLLLVPPLYMLQVFDRVITSRSQETLIALSAAAAVGLLFMALLEVVRGRLLAAAGIALDRMLGPRVLEGLLGRLAGNDFSSGLRDVNTLRSFFVGTGVLAMLDAPWLPFFLLIIFLFHPLLGFIALGGAILMCLLAFLNERFARRPLARVASEGRRAGRFIDMSARNTEVISALGMLPAVTRRWSAMNDAVLREQVAASAVGARFSGWTKFARQLIQSAMLAAGAWLVLEQHVSAGIMIAATILLGRALAPVEMVVASWRGLVDARAAWRRLDDLLTKNPPAEPSTDLPAPAGRLEAEGVAFKIAERLIIRGASFRLAPGEALGIIGHPAISASDITVI